MELRKGTMKNSPFVGVFAKATDAFVLVPKQAQKKEIAGLRDFFGVEIISTNIVNSSLLGVYAIANKHGVMLPELSEESELKQLEQAGLRVKKLSWKEEEKKKTTEALGNLFALNDSKGVYSKMVPKEKVKEIENFLKVELEQVEIAGSDLVGSAMVATNRGFIAHAGTTKKELEFLEKLLGVKGKATSANYGDPFVGKSVVANSNAALVGLHTTPHEMFRIDEGLGRR